MLRRLIIGAAAIALVTGCTVSSEPADAPQQEAGPANLTFWMTGTETDKAMVESAAKLYTAQKPEVKVTVQSLTWEDGLAKVLAASAAKEGPDIITGGFGWAKELGEQGGMVDLKEFGVSEEVRGKINPGVYDPLVAKEGQVYGVPMSVAPHLFYYQTETLAKAGITEPPTTWEELSAAIAKLREAGVKTPFAIGFGNLSWLSFFNYVYQAGGQPYAEDCSEVTLDSPAAVTALEYWTNLYTEGNAPRDQVDLPQGFVDGTIAMADSGSWMVKVWEAAKPELKGKWGFSALPAGPANNLSAPGGSIIGVTSYSPHKQQAAEFVRFLYTDEAIKAMSETASARGALYLSARSDEALIEAVGLPAEQTKTLSAGVNATIMPPSCPGFEDVQGDIDKKLQAVVYKDADPATTIAEIDKMLTTALEAS